MPIEAASVHFLIGMCQSELGRRLGALDAFNNAIRVNPDYAEVKYVSFDFPGLLTQGSQTGIFENRILLLVRFFLSNQSIHKYFSLLW